MTRVKQRKSKKTALLLFGLVAGMAAGGALYAMPGFQHMIPEGWKQEAKTAEPPAPKYREAVEFRMTDFDHGWIRYADGIMATSDGGSSWVKADNVPVEVATGSHPEDQWMILQESKPVTTIKYLEKEYSLKQMQMMTDRVGWALVQDQGAIGEKLFVTTDGGVSWQSEVTSGVKDAIQEEKRLLQRMQTESQWYASKEQAEQAFRSEWLLIPGTVSQGDVALIRHNKPGTMDWQGKTYTLQPFGAGYFTYLPISTEVKPGDYPIGDQILKVTAQNFPKQYLQVTEEMNSMRQDTKRIQADQVKIDAARSISAPEFLFTSEFIKPIEGILTTPYGHMRYVNGKLSGSHLALDLAAKQGTPIKATNDGVVALADSLYLTGNSIYIDHGIGLFSQYAHLSELKVKTGDKVKKGDIIGLVGSTGFSTGPHLHFTFWANNVPVNPNLYFNTTPFHWLGKPQ